jgi:hypothetical protein
MIAKEHAKLRVLRQNPPVGSEPSRANRVKDKATQGVASSWHFLGPHYREPVPSSFVSEFWTGGFLHAPTCGLAPNCSGFPARDYSGKTLETTWPGFDRGGINPYLILWRGACPSWLSLTNGDPCSTQILILHYGTKS